MEIGPYDKERDRDACHRIWEEVGWLDRSNESNVEGVDALYEAGRAIVARIDGEAECLVLGASGSLRYLDEDIPFSGVTGVTVSRVARKKGLAAQLTSRLIAEEADAGAWVSGLGMFEQGFYNRLGYGTGTYVVRSAFDPQTLNVPFSKRSPKRLTKKDIESLHQARRDRQLHHGFVSFDSENLTHQQVTESSTAFGLGYFDGPGGELSHYMWVSAGKGENGPYEVMWISHQSGEQFLELMGVLRTLGDQVRRVRMTEPPGVQLQDFVRQPIQDNIVRDGSKFETGTRAMAWWQVRICDMEGCLSRTHLRGDTVRFNLKLSDPITEFLEEREGWRGVGGEYIVTLGPESAAETGSDASLPTLTSTVNAFTRLWLGVRPASGLAITDDLAGPPELIERLDWALRIPSPVRDWDF